MTARFILLSIVVLALFAVISLPLVIETISDLLHRSKVRPGLGSFDDDES